MATQSIKDRITEAALVSTALDDPNVSLVITKDQADTLLRCLLLAELTKAKKVMGGRNR